MWADNIPVSTSTYQIPMSSNSHRSPFSLASNNVTKTTKSNQWFHLLILGINSVGDKLLKLNVAKYSSANGNFLFFSILIRGRSFPDLNPRYFYWNFHLT